MTDSRRCAKCGQEVLERYSEPYIDPEDEKFLSGLDWPPGARELVRKPLVINRIEVKTPSNSGDINPPKPVRVTPENTLKVEFP